MRKREMEMEMGERWVGMDWKCILIPPEGLSTYELNEQLLCIMVTLDSHYVNYVYMCAGSRFLRAKKW